MNNIPLHTHTDCSLLDGILKVKDYVKWGVDNNLSALGISDHGSVSNNLDFYKLCKENNINPLMGSEFYLTANTDEKVRDNHHIILYAMNYDGWINLIKLVTESNKEENYFYKPRINYELLEKYNSNLICLSACLGGHFQQLILEDKIDEAESVMLKYKEIFENRYYLELQEHFLPEQKLVNSVILEWSKKYNIPMVITTDAHMLDKSYEEAHDVLLCKNTNSKVSDEKRFRFSGEGYYLQNTDKLRSRFNWLEDETFYDCVNNSNIIASRCNVEINYSEYRMPKIEIPKDYTVNEYFVKVIKEGFKTLKYPLEKRHIYIERLKEEIKLVIDLNFQDYMLMLYDVYKYCKENDIMTNFSRGSGTSSLVLLCLGVTKVDPIKHNLPMSRFINKKRITICDFDCDIEDTRREEVINYVREKHGSDKVSNIIAFGTMQAKGAIKAVASALDFPFEISNKITSLMTLNASIDENLSNNKEFLKIYNENNDFKKVVDIASRLEGIKSSVSVHPSGVICCDIPIDNICPIVRTKDGYATAFDMSIVEPVLKLVKYDFLGLKTLTIVKDTFGYLKRKDINLSLESINYEDISTFTMLSNGDSNTCFQFESNLMQKLLKDVKPTNIDELAIVNAIARPASLSSGLTQDYINCRQGKKEPEYLIPEFKEDMALTYGLCIFQEGLILMASKMSGLGMEFGDLVRVACAKKKPEAVAKIKKQFYDGCRDFGRDEKLINKCFEIIEWSAGYGFSSCHSVPYSYLSYVTAYLKCHYPLEYMCAILNANFDDSDDMQRYVAEIYKLGIKISPPKINTSEVKFAISEDDIIYGLNTIKGLGSKICEKIINARTKYGNFTSILDFCTRVKPDKKALTSLIESNCFSEIEPYPKKWLNLIDYLCSAISDYKKDGSVRIIELMKKYILKDTIKSDIEIIRLQNEKRAIAGASKLAREQKAKIDERIKQRELELYPLATMELMKNNFGFSKTELRDNEIKYLSAQVTTNPNNVFQKYKHLFEFTEIEDISIDDTGKDIVVIGEIKDLREIVCKNGKKMAFSTLNYLGNSIGITVFDKQWKDINSIKNGDFVKVFSKVQENKNKEFGELNLIVNKANILNCISTEETYTQDITGWSKDSIDMLKEGLTLMSDECYNNNEEINKILIIKKDDKEKVAKSKYWISDFERYRKFLIRYNLISI